MLRKNIYATLIVILMLGAASAQTDKQGVPGYTDPLRTDLEKKNDREIDRAYQSTVKALSDTEKKKSDPWGDIRPPPPAATKNKRSKATDLFDSFNNARDFAVSPQKLRRSHA